jgi:alpha-L-fucosidase
MNRREFLASTTALAATTVYPGLAQTPASTELPTKVQTYIEDKPVDDYKWASPSAYEAFQDMKFGVRVHWGIYSIWHRGAESWPFLKMTFEDRQKYNDLYKTWNPVGFDANEWVGDFKDSGAKMFAITTKHHEGFSMFDTKTRVTTRANWTAPGGPKMEPCDLSYSIMETPFRRDVIKELCDAAHKKDVKIDLYFSHPDWYDAHFRPYAQHPLQVPSAAKMTTALDVQKTLKSYGDHPVIVPDPSPAEVEAMMERHRAQLVELLTNYGKIDMMCLDMHLGPQVWPELRKTVLKLREIQPDVMLRNRGIEHYGDYSTPERVIPGSNSEIGGKPWFCIYPLGKDFSYDDQASRYKGTEWIVHNLADVTAKGGGLMIGIGPSANGQFHPEGIRQMKAAGVWLKTNGEAIYATRPREGDLWSEGDDVRYTRSKDQRTVYAIMTKWPGKQITLKSVCPKPGSKVTLLGVNAPVAWTFDSAQGTTFTLPENLQQASNRPCEYAWSLKVEEA